MGIARTAATWGTVPTALAIVCGGLALGGTVAAYEFRTAGQTAGTVGANAPEFATGVKEAFDFHDKGAAPATPPGPPAVKTPTMLGNPTGIAAG